LAAAEFPILLSAQETIAFHMKKHFALWHATCSSEGISAHKKKANKNKEIKGDRYCVSAKCCLNCYI
jgi:hypothetical protein